jgi:hypothetical protein
MSVDAERLKQAVLAALEHGLDAGALAHAVAAVTVSPATDATVATGVRAVDPPIAGQPTTGAKRLLTKIVLGDLLDDAILAARPQDRTFPLRLFFAELGRGLASDEAEGADGASAASADVGFALASGLNFFFRAPMDAEAKLRVGLETSRAFYAFAHAVPLDAELVAKAAPLLAALLSTELDKVRLEAVDHAKVFDSQVHERVDGADPTASRIVRPATFLCRVSANNAVKAKAQVLT